MSVRVKICGITCVEDALAAVDAGADALGFMFHPASPRHVEPALVTAIATAGGFPPFVSRVGVFVDPTEEAVRCAMHECGLDTVQLHGSESPDFCRALGPLSVIKAFRMRGAESLEELERYRDWPWLLDSYVSGALGGTGKTFNWTLAAEAVARGGRVVLAGGLSPANVADAVLAVRPWAVDVSSGVESAPGRKDAAKMREFVRAAKSVPL